MGSPRRPRTSPPPARSPSGTATELTDEERRSLTHGDFWIPAEERVVFGRAIELLGQREVPFVVSGLYALHHHTGIYRRTKDLDLLFEPTRLVEAARVLRAGGFETRLESPHWLAKATLGGAVVDLVFGMANGLHLIDPAWHRYSRSGTLAGHPVRVAAPEELILHRLFISERHRSDTGDIVHLIMRRGDEVDWERLIERVGEHWRLLLGQIHFFDFCYPGRRGQVPDRTREALERRSAEERGKAAADPAVCQGTLISRFSFAIDVNEWGFRDFRQEAIAATLRLPIVQEIGEADVWDSVNPTGDFQVPDPVGGPARLPVLDAPPYPGVAREGR